MRKSELFRRGHRAPLYVFDCHVTLFAMREATEEQETSKSDREESEVTDLCKAAVAEQVSHTLQYIVWEPFGLQSSMSAVCL